MKTQDLLENKGNIFEHLLYEFEMYIVTYSELISLVDTNDKSVFIKNVLLESHAVHLRNLIDFFNCEQNSINTKMIFIGNHDFSFDDSKIGAKQTINKAVNHLTKERYIWNQTDKDLTVKFNEIIHIMYNQYFAINIRKCVSLLVNKTDINSSLYDDLQNKSIQMKLKWLECILKP